MAAHSVKDLEDMILWPKFSEDASCLRSFKDSITLDCFWDPVVCNDGFTYERKDIEQWFEIHNTSPRTGAILSSKDLRPNHDLKGSIAEIFEKYKEKNPFSVEQLNLETEDILPVSKEKLTFLSKDEQHELRLLTYLIKVAKFSSEKLDSRFKRLTDKAENEHNAAATPLQLSPLPTPSAPPLSDWYPLSLDIVPEEMKSRSEQLTDKATVTPLFTPQPPSPYPAASAPPLLLYPHLADRHSAVAQSVQYSSPPSSSSSSSSVSSQYLDSKIDSGLSNFINGTFNRKISPGATQARYNSEKDLVSIEIGADINSTEKLTYLLHYLESKELLLSLSYEYSTSTKEVKVNNAALRFILNHLSAKTSEELNDIFKLLKYRCERANMEETRFGISKKDKLAAVDKVLQYLIDRTPLNQKKADINALQDGKLNDIIDSLKERYPSLKQALTSKSSFNFFSAQSNEQSSASSAKPAEVNAFFMGNDTPGKSYLEKQLSFEKEIGLCLNVAQVHNVTLNIFVEHRRSGDAIGPQLGNMNALIICFDVMDRSSFGSIKAWINEAGWRCRNNPKSAKIFIVATNSDDPNRKVSKIEVETFIACYFPDCIYIETTNTKESCQNLLAQLAFYCEETVASVRPSQHN